MAPTHEQQFICIPKVRNRAESDRLHDAAHRQAFPDEYRRRGRPTIYGRELDRILRQLITQNPRAKVTQIWRSAQLEWVRSHPGSKAPGIDAVRERLKALGFWPRRFM